MKKQLFTITAVVIAVFGLSFCTNSNAENKNHDANSEYTEAAPSISNAKKLLDSKCMVCHKIQDSQDAMLAPPFAHIKKKYSKVTKNKAAFIEAFASFAINPTEEEAMMFGALKQFKVMPKMENEKAEMELIANYIYDNEFPEPSWCKK